MVRIRAVASYAALTCAGAALAGAAASCVASSNPSGPGGEDASFSFDGSPGPVVDSSLPAVDAGADAARAPDADAGAAVVDAADATVEDSAPPTDAAQPLDASDAADAIPPCGPSSITGFVVPPYLPSASRQLIACNNGESMALGADCYGDASTQVTCAAFADSGDDGGPVSATCLGCLFTPEGSDAGYGPIVEGVVPVVNVAGCVEQNDQSDAGYVCAVAVQAAWECAEFACKTTCPVTDPASVAAYTSCTTQAAIGVCSTYAQAAQTCLAAEAADAGTPTQVQMNCFDGTTPILEYFCGS